MLMIIFDMLRFACQDDTSYEKMSARTGLAMIGGGVVHLLGQDFTLGRQIPHRRWPPPHWKFAINVNFESSASQICSSSTIYGIERKPGKSYRQAPSLEGRQDTQEEEQAVVEEHLEEHLEDH